MRSYAKWLAQNKPILNLEKAIEKLKEFGITVDTDKPIGGFPAGDFEDPIPNYEIFVDGIMSGHLEFNSCHKMWEIICYKKDQEKQVRSTSLKDEFVVWGWY